jgi:hypothetical protein
MKKRISALLTALLVVMLVLTGCNSSEADNKENSTYKDYYSNKVKYVGNNSEVIRLLGVLGVGNFGQFTIALTTDKEPYGLTINYSNFKENVDEVNFMTMEQTNYPFFLLALVDNLSFVDVNYKTYNYHLDIEKANKTLDGNIKSYGSSPEKLKELHNKLNPKN